ncbi:beta strand repeat-containing protein [Aliarcobacter cryaerophilus]|uniref:beta strand repeat-containing protein n=1 Tax=Aliarcobacter cryaerophilus TaxID=28198 RepID=UPI0021B69CFF|nr:GLUG motif-containing protein [Aliarcobacter cryaerophilus]MCT7472655.1 YDG domain-containing protein [Aliarcobacter cryaerophilus]
MYYKNEYKNRFRILKGGLISLVVASNLYGAPSGGTVVSGNATISQNANTTNINQSSNKAVINWQDFSIKSNEIVNFNQPNVNSITLNRVIGNEKSIIDGALNANGQVWLINSNGVLFGKNAKVNTAGIVASTKDISNEDFNNGNYNFKGNSTASIVNEGEIKSLANTHATFIANSVTNKGKIEVHKGTINLVGASDVTLTLNENQNLSLKVNKGVVDALVDNQNLIVANGGQIYLTTNAKDELLKGVVNHSGIIEANSLDELTQSEVILFAHGGTTNVDGSIIAKNSFVETSGEKLNVTSNTKVVAKDWLLDPTNILIESTGGDVLTGESVSATAIQNNLETTNVHLQATNNITVNQNITWSTDKQLKLEANNINVNATINNTNQTNGGVYFQAANNVVFDTNGKVIVNNLYQLQWMNTALNGKYELGRDIDAGATKTDTANWGIEGWNPIGDYSNRFTGTFDGLGFTISNLYINRPSQNYVGLFGYTNNATIKNIGLKDVNITGSTYVGGLVGRSENGGTISNSYASGSVTGFNDVGGLVGWNFQGTITNSYASGSVDGTDFLGGLVGTNRGTITNSYASGSVDGTDFLGGLVGLNYGTITNSYASGSVDGHSYVGGLVGLNYGTITNSYASGSVDGHSYVGGLVGLNYGTITNSYASGSVDGHSYVGGLVGRNTPGTIEKSFYDKETNIASMNDSSYGKTKAEIATALKNASSEWETDLSKGRGYGTGGNTDLPFLKNVTKLSNTLFEDGFGTPLNPYKITNWTQLQNINNSNILTQDYYFSLLNNLSNLTADYSTFNSGLGWNPIGDNSTLDDNSRFTGTFDGLGFTISNLYINRPTQSDIGLFGYTNNATIKNIGLNNVDITGNSYVGGLLGYKYGGTISNSYSSGSVNGNLYIGGLVGFNENGIISNSYATGSVNGNYTIGGLVGYSYGTISNSYATGSVNGDYSIGGLVGYNYSGTISNSFYDKTKYTGNGVGYGNQNGVTGKTTQEMSYGETFKNASWDIVADSSVTSLTPVIKWDSANNKYVWAIAPLALTYTLEDKTTTYNGTTQNLSTFYNNSTNIFGTNHSFIDLSKYKFQVAGSDVTGYKDADIYDNIKLVNNSDSFAILNASGNTDGKLTINKKDLTISNITANNKTYDGTTTATLSNIGTLDGLVTGEDLTLSNTSVVFSDKNVADGIVVTATGYTIADKDSFKASNYNLTQTSKTTNANISKASLTATLNDNSKTYDGTSYSGGNGITFNGFVNSETASLLGGNLVYSGTSQGAKDAGNYIISGSGLTSNNYNISFVDGKLTINKKDLTISNITANNKTYDGTTTATLSNIGTLDGLVTGEDLTLSNTSVVFSDKNVADGIVVTATGYTIADKDSFKASNYNLTQTSKTTNANISKASLTATLNDNSKTYDGTSYSGGNGITFNGFVNSETASLLGGNLVYSGTSQGAKDAGNYIISGSGLTSNNYNISFVDGKLTINKKDLTISNITANNKTYDGTTTATLSNIGTLDGLVTGEDLVLNNPTSVIFSSKDVADGITVTASGYTIADKDSFKASNYNLIDTSKTTTANIVASVNPTPTVDEKVQRVIASIEPSTNSNSSSNQSVPNSLNSNIRTLSFNGVDETRVINGGVKMPENIANEEDIIK